MSLQNCEVELGEPLDALSSPTAATMTDDPARYYAGAAIVNHILIVVTVLVGLIAAGFRLYYARGSSAQLKRRAEGNTIGSASPSQGLLTAPSAHDTSATDDPLAPTGGDVPSASRLEATDVGQDPHAAKHEGVYAPTLQAAIAFVRCPSFQLFPALFLLQPTVSAAIVCLRHSSDAGVRTIGTVSFVLCIGLIAALVAPTLTGGSKRIFVPCNEDDLDGIGDTGATAAQRKAARARRRAEAGVGKRLFRFLIFEAGTWEDAPGHGGYCRQYGAFFDEFKGETGWFMAVEVVFSSLLGLAEPLAVGGSCFPFVLSITILYLFYVCALAFLRPHLARLNFGFALAMGSTQLVAGVCVSALAYTGLRHEKLRMFVDGLISAAMFLSILKTIYDVAQFVYRIGWRKYVARLRASRETPASYAQFGSGYEALDEEVQQELVQVNATVEEDEMEQLAKGRRAEGAARARVDIFDVGDLDDAIPTNGSVTSATATGFARRRGYSSASDPLGPSDSHQQLLRNRPTRVSVFDVGDGDAIDDPLADLDDAAVAAPTDDLDGILGGPSILTAGAAADPGAFNFLAPIRDDGGAAVSTAVPRISLEDEAGGQQLFAQLTQVLGQRSTAIFDATPDASVPSTPPETGLTASPSHLSPTRSPRVRSNVASPVLSRRPSSSIADYDDL